MDKVNIGSLAYREPELFTSWIEVFGADRIILSADVRDNYIATHGWQATESTLLSGLHSGYGVAGNHLAYRDRYIERWCHDRAGYRIVPLRMPYIPRPKPDRQRRYKEP